MTTNEKKTLGAKVIEAQQKDAGIYNAMDLASESLSNFDKSVLEAVERGIKEYPQSTFYVEVCHVHEKLLDTVGRNFFSVRKSAPTPEYNQTVFQYNHQKDSIEFLWTLPDRNTCLSFYYNKSQVDPSDYDILDQILSLYDGRLIALVKKLNHED